MIGIEYSKNTGLYTNIIMAMLNSAEIGAFVNKIKTDSYICFNPDDRESVRLCAKPDPAASVCLYLDTAKIQEIAEQANGLLNYHIPAHIYIDLDGGYQIMISNNEYPRALARASAEP